MIEINLLPEELRKKRREIKVISEISKAIILRIIVIVFFIHLGLGLLTLIRLINLHRLNRIWSEFGGKREEFDNLRKEMETLEKIKLDLNKLAGIKILWSKKLNIISDKIPKGIWLREIFCSKDKFKIEASCVSKKLDKTERIRNFLENLRKDSDFSKDFRSLELESVTRKSIKGQEILDFTLSGEIKI